MWGVFVLTNWIYNDFPVANSLSIFVFSLKYPAIQEASTSS